MLSRRDQVVLRQQRLELAPEEEVDPCEQDRRHVPNLTASAVAFLAGEPERLEEAVQVDAQAPELAREEERAERDEDETARRAGSRRSGRGRGGRRPSPARRARPRPGTGAPARARRRRAGPSPRAPCPSRPRARGSSRAPGRCTARRRRRRRRRAGSRSRGGARPGASPAPTSRSGQGSRPMNTSPKTIRTKPAICSSRNWLRVIERPTAAAPAPSRTKTATSPATNGRLATHHPPRRAGLAEPVGLDRRDRREVAGHERQHAGGEERDEAGAERDDHGRAAHASKRASSASSRRSSSGSSGSPRRAGGASPRRRLQRQARTPHGDRADREPGERQQPGEPVEALPRRHGQHASGRTGRRASP